MTTQTESSTDRITRQLEIAAPVANVWRALTDSTRFAAWFRIEFDGPFVVGQSVNGRFKNGLTIEFQIERMEPEIHFAYRWHPYPVDPTIDYSAEQPTLVEFHLEKIPTGTRLTITESGFDSIPLARRAEAFRMNTAGWESKSKDLAAYVTA
jgi:uncharacterized protein YndB with AHSA1/START domain